MSRSDRPHLMKSPNFVALVRRIRDSVTKVKDSHEELRLVGAAGFEPTASLVFNQGALTAELYAYH